MLKRLLPATAALLALSLLAACGNEADNDEAVDSSTGASTPAESPSDEPAADATSCEYPEDASEPAKAVEPPPAEATASGTVSGTISTNVGDIAIELDADRTPCTVNNFLSLAEQGYFDDTQCHRLTTEGIYVLQCGDPTASGMGGPGYTIPDEVDGTEKYGPGVLAMAKTSAPDSGGSQFFLVYADSGVLDPVYTEFGTIDEDGVALLEEIAAKGTAEGGPDGSPKDEVTISGVTVG
ncbi:peptidylprolyl isomerase [Nocardioides sp. Soil805]|uniref:peptidylprolyl isomerase n=1 Tax=Nocardioides sp. Soil805 TaxID=1736416 RepID=UPI000703699E|nr:peptidylprolyl isomerase [Nocardioides sp. Soil805]KRF32383.1 peptidylprolyl isomerase [Nocardioides sp. Soil805]